MEQRYSATFYDEHEEGALRSAEVIVPLVLQLTCAKRIIDVGCGRGAWLKAFREHGVGHIQGVDGGYVEGSRLLIPEQCFSVADLARPFHPPGRFDLAVCLEVAEHLPPETAESLVDSLTTVAPLILFSAAVPGQGGHHHVNERWPDYWRGLFAARGFSLVDAIRPRVLTDTRVQWWYRQNAVIYASEPGLMASPALREYVTQVDGRSLEWIHVSVAGPTRRESWLRLLLNTVVRGATGRAAQWRRQLLYRGTR